MKAVAQSNPSPTAVAQEQRQMTVEAGGLKVGLEKAETDLARLSNRLSALTMLTGKQYFHLRSLCGTKSAPQVVSLPSYRDMRLKHARTKAAAIDAHSLIATAKKNIAEAKTRLKFLEEKLKVNQALLDSYGKVLQLRKM